MDLSWYYYFIPYTKYEMRVGHPGNEKKATSQPPIHTIEALPKLLSLCVYKLHLTDRNKQMEGYGLCH